MPHLQILGPACGDCEALAHRVAAVARELGIDCQLERVTDVQRIVALGVLTTPALLVDGRAAVVGRVPSSAELRRVLGAAGDGT